ncbi:MAG: OadG family protein [Bacteroidales bacterium]
MNNIPILLDTSVTASSAEEFVLLDPYGIGMAVIAMLVVTAVLTVAAVIFQNIDNLISLFTKMFSNRKKTSGQSEEIKEKLSTSGDDIAAIALALHLYQSELHDTESLTLTMNKISRTYSPWSSKIYGVMNTAVKRTPYLK